MIKQQNVKRTGTCIDLINRWKRADTIDQGLINVYATKWSYPIKVSLSIALATYNGSGLNEVSDKCIGVLLVAFYSFTSTMLDIYLTLNHGPRRQILVDSIRQIGFIVKGHGWEFT